MVSVVLAVFLKAIGMSEVQIGAIVTATLLGSAVTTLVVGLKGHRIPRRTLLLAATMLMAATGIGFALISTFWGLMVVGLVGTLNPSGGDVSLFLPTEQALLPRHDARRGTARRCSPGTPWSARWSPPWARCAPGCRIGWRVGSTLDHTTALRIPFVVYALLAGVIALRYRRLSPTHRAASRDPGALARLAVDRVPARRAVQRRLIRRRVRDHSPAGRVAPEPLRAVVWP